MGIKNLTKSSEPIKSIHNLITHIGGSSQIKTGTITTMPKDKEKLENKNDKTLPTKLFN